jgi:signal transduction histidine kinase
MEYQTWKYQVRESSVSHELITPLRCLSKLA